MQWLNNNNNDKNRLINGLKRLFNNNYNNNCVYNRQKNQNGEAVNNWSIRGKISKYGYQKL